MRTSSSIGSTSHGGPPRSLDFATIRLASRGNGFCLFAHPAQPFEHAFLRCWAGLLSA